MPDLNANVEGLDLATSTTPASRVLAVDYTLPWHLVIHNVTGGDITQVKVRSRTHEKAPWTAWETVTSGLPLKSPDTLSLVEKDTRAQAIEVELTANADGVATFWLAGV